MWSNSGFESETLPGLINQTALFHVNKYHYENDTCLMVHTPMGEIEASPSELIDFNEAVHAKIDELETDAYLNRSDSKKYNEYMSDCADNNWKKRD